MTFCLSACVIALLFLSLQALWHSAAVGIAVLYEPIREG
jgi:hypothetical protein